MTHAHYWSMIAGNSPQEQQDEDTSMAIEIIDVGEIAHRKKARTKVMNTRKMHAWVHYYPNPGDHDDMHCHNADQTFICFEGECTMRFPDGGKAVLKPGMAALINGGSFYQLEKQMPGLLFKLVG